MRLGVQALNFFFKLEKTCKRQNILVTKIKRGSYLIRDFKTLYYLYYIIIKLYVSVHKYWLYLNITLLDITRVYNIINNITKNDG